MGHRGKQRGCPKQLAAGSWLNCNQKPGPSDSRAHTFSVFKPGLKHKHTLKLIIKGGQGTSGKNKTHPIYKKEGIVGRASPLVELEKHKTSERGYIRRKHCKSIMETEAQGEQRQNVSLLTAERQKLSLKQMPYFWSLVKSLFSFSFYI